MKLKCLCKNVKRELDGKKKIWSIFLIVLGILIWIVLPTGTPDDLATTIPLILFLGMIKYLILVGILVILFFINFKKMVKLFKRLKRKC
ncbi:MAG: hypothetical protein KKB88_00325 [Nanoarchaeota archaeon]|nr:hypothetical protein [Nanoarchaeota archaeon]